MLFRSVALLMGQLVQALERRPAASPRAAVEAAVRAPAVQAASAAAPGQRGTPAGRSIPAPVTSSFAGSGQVRERETRG